MAFDEIAALAESSEPEERQFAHEHLFRSYPLAERTWDILLNHLIKSSRGEALPVLAYFLAHIPWHGDLWGNADYPFGGDYRELLESKIQRLGKEEIIKLLLMIDPEQGIARGTIGQCVQAVISAITAHEVVLSEIVVDEKIGLLTREFAALIVAIGNPAGSIILFEKLSRSGSEYAPEIIKYISESNHFNPYS